MADPYDIVPYTGHVTPNTAPRHLALCSAWHGGPLPPVRGYRALEIACGEGTNLIALAYYQPESSFHGFDRSVRAISRARVAASEIGLTNVRFEVRDLRDENAFANGRYDYIIAHGVHSWIPEDARRTVLELIRDRLSPAGLALVSYNVRAGWAVRSLLRDVLLRARAVREAPLREKAARAASVVEALLADLPAPRSRFGALLAEELGLLAGYDPSYLVHEYLAEVNDPLWFGDFAEGLADVDLIPVVDAQFCRHEGQLPPQVVDAVGKRDLGVAEREDTLDLLCHRRMRMTVICRRDAPRCDLSRRALLRMSRIATPLAARSDPFRFEDGEVEAFDGVAGATVEASDTLEKASIVLLATRWPGGLALGELIESARSLVEGIGLECPSNEEEELEEALMDLFWKGQVELRLAGDPWNQEVPERPAVHALARVEAMQTGALTSPNHVSWAFGEKESGLLSSLDGTRRMSEVVRGSAEGLARRTIETAARYGLLSPDR